MTVRIAAEAPGAGVITDVLADLHGTGVLTDALPVDPASRIVLERECTFADLGTFLVAARVRAQVDGDAADLLARVPNIARAGVTVTE